MTQLKEKTVGGRVFDYSPTHGTYVLNEGGLTLALAPDGNVVPLEYYKLTQTDTVHQNGDVSRTREITPIPATHLADALEQQKAKTAIAKEKIHEQLYNIATAGAAWVFLVGGVFLAYTATMYAIALGASASLAVGGAVVALNEILYFVTWAGFVVFCIVVIRYFLLRGTASEKAPTDQVNPSAPAQEVGKQQINININQGEGGYNHAQNFVQPK